MINSPLRRWTVKTLRSVSEIGELERSLYATAAEVRTVLGISLATRWLWLLPIGEIRQHRIQLLDPLSCGSSSGENDAGRLTGSLTTPLPPAVPHGGGSR
jgi:hypothetical protein